MKESLYEIFFFLGNEIGLDSLFLAAGVKMDRWPFFGGKKATIERLFCFQMKVAYGRKRKIKCIPSTLKLVT